MNPIHILRASFPRRAALALLLALPAAAQECDHGGDFHQSGLLDLRGATSGSFGRVVTGEWTGDGVIDALFLRGGSAHVVSGIVEYGRVLDLTGGVADLAVFPRVGSQQIDRFFTAGDGGLELWTWNPVADGFDSSPIGVGWGTVEHVRVTAYAPTWTLVVAVDAQDVVHPMLFNRGDGSMLFSWPAFPAGPDVGGLELGDFDGDTLPELAVSSAAGLSFLELDGTGTLVPRTPGSLPADDVLAWMPPAQASAAQRVAWFTRGILGSFVRVAAPGSVGGEAWLNGRSVVAAAGGDVDGDGDFDLAVSTPESGRAGLLRNQESGGPPASFLFEDLGQSTGLAQSQAGLALADLNNDGDLDLLLPDDVLEDWHFLGGTAVDARQLRLEVGDEVTYFPGFDFVLWIHWLIGDCPPEQATGLRFIAWGGEDPLAAQHSIPLQTWNEVVPSVSDYQKFFFFSTPPAGFESYRFLEARYVSSPPGQPLRALPPQVVFTTMDPDLFAAMEAALVLGQGPFEGLFDGARGCEFEPLAVDCGGVILALGGEDPIRPGTGGTSGVIIRVPEVPID